METEPVFHSEDVDDELQALYRQRIRERVRVPEMIVESYRTAWASFYGWEPGYSEHVLRSLQAPHVGSAASNIADLLEIRDFNSMEVDSDPSLVFTVLSTDLGSRPRSFQVHDITLPDVPVEHFAYPKYESCTPATRNISHDRDPRILDFIPYADEPDFSLSLYARLHASFAWQNIWYDVDYKLIALHTAWSLYASGLSPKEMDEYQVRFLPPIIGSSGLLTTLRNRDLIDWGTAVSSQQLVALWDASLKATRPPGPNLWRSVRSLDAAFCRSTNCIEALCMLHKAPKPPPRHAKHKKTNEEYMEGTRPCGAKCYRAAQNLEEGDIMEINQDICDVLKVFPDAPICKLALLCKADCRDVYYHRMMYLPNKNSAIPEQVIVDRKAPRAGAIQYLSDVCDHSGPCVPPLCICAIRQEWCNRRCGCFGRCGARKGCTCEDGKCLDNAEVNGDLSRLCPCIDAGWECSPELCSGVRNRRLKKNMKHTCRSMYLQKDKKPTIVVKQATFGLGAFANGKMPAGTFLGEYIAEKYPLADEKIDRAVRRVNWHRGLNYMFSLNDDSGVLDAATVGDPTRCLNDSLNKDDLNVKAEPTTVDGDMRIYFWAFKDVKKDEELLLGYGEGYWANYFVSNTDEDEETLGDEDQVDADDEKDELEEGWRA